MRRQPTQQRAKATCDAIVEAGFLCMARYGLAGTTTRHIAETAGVGVASLYDYFKDKEAVFEAMNARLVEDTVGTISPVVPDMMKLDLGGATQLMLRTYGELLKRNDGRYLHWVRERSNELKSANMEPVHQMLNDIFMRYLLHHPHYTRIPDLATAHYIFLKGGMLSVLHFLGEERPPITFDDLVNGLARMVNHYANGELARVQAEQAG